MGDMGSSGKGDVEGTARAADGPAATARMSRLWHARRRGVEPAGRSHVALRARHVPRRSTGAPLADVCRPNHPARRHP